MALHKPNETRRLQSLPHMFRGILIVAIVFLLTSSSVFAAKYTKDSLDMIKKRVTKDEAVIIDVREEKEWKRGHLKAAKLLSLSDLERGVNKENLDELFPKDKVIYLHCAAGARCINAAEILEQQGYKVMPIKHSYDELLKAGFEQEK